MKIGVTLSQAVIHIDLKKAFEQVPHKRILEKKIQSPGEGGSNLTAQVTDWLTGRKHFIPNVQASESLPDTKEYRNGHCWDSYS